ncbi:nuclease-related domain-containing protein [Fictibacillus norfolkensis]|uniref:NERD domain-containing protein n=1 Tax=Fictibacillus norfolkensis TaxID=2762233 RepID=A0ABR8SP82_9BACL|nr:nuclease-related domain-containing protein [Fictibacillus norfolkensis]MBD7965286.1 NERD domain-containing protein [Fictibacillus norfolkensis]
MIKKTRTKPLKLLKFEVLLERILPSHSQIQNIESNYRKYLAGFRGELTLDYYLSELQKDNYHIFHDLRIPRYDNNQLFFQLDALILHPRFCIIIEVKNLIGNLYFDHQYDQIVRTREGLDETFPDPVNQVGIQKKHLSHWLFRHKCPLIPIHTLVVITNPKSYIRISPKYGSNAQKIIRGRTLPSKIKEIEKLESEVILQKRDIKRISSLLLKEHTSHNPDILKLFNIHRNEILTGVFCPNCTQITLIRIKRNWLCTRCSKTYMDAHKKAIIDYALLFSPVVKNKDVRLFLHMQSQSSVKKLLYSMKLKPTGSRKAATYTIPLPK